MTVAIAWVLAATGVVSFKDAGKLKSWDAWNDHQAKVVVTNLLQKERRCVTWQKLNRLEVGLEEIGRLATRTSAEIKSSKWSVGCETMDRDYAVWDNYKDLLPLRKFVKGYSGAFDILQGEVGCPSQLEFAHALNGHEWTEYSQAKWNLRRAIGDAVRSIPSSCFTMIDLQYTFMLQSFVGEYFRRTREAVKAFDRDLLYLGCRFAWTDICDTPYPIMRQALREVAYPLYETRAKQADR